MAVLDRPAGDGSPPRHRLAARDRRRGAPRARARPDEGQRGDRRGRDRRRVRRVLRLPDHAPGGAPRVDGAPDARGGPRVRPGGERARRDQHGAGRRRRRGEGARLQLQPGHQPHGRGDVLHGRVAACRCVLVNVMRGGPGLGSIGAAQGDYLQATKGHGHGDYRVPVLAPSSIAEAIELVGDAFVLAERYRTPVMMLADGILGQAMEPVEAGVPDASRASPPTGSSRAPTAASRASSARCTSSPEDLEAHNDVLQATYARDHANASHAGPARRSTTPRSCSSRTARPHGSRGRPSSGRGPKGSGRAVPADHAVAVPGRRPPIGRPRGARRARGGAVRRAARRGRAARDRG